MADKTMQLVEVTPEMAVEILSSNYEDQRNINKAAVEKLRRAMEAGEWAPEIAGPIIVSEDGELLDGQHRLTAVVLHGEPVPMWVYRGASAKDFPKIDSGMGRTMAQALPWDAKNKTVLASMLKYVTAYKENGFGTGLWFERVPAYVGREEYESNRDDYDRIASEAVAIRKSYASMSTGTLAFFIWLMERTDRETAEAVKAGLRGEGKDAWMYRVINVWILHRTGPGRTVKPPVLFRCLCCIWNAAVEGRTLAKPVVHADRPIRFLGVTAPFRVIDGEHVSA